MADYWDKPSPLHEKAAELRIGASDTSKWRLSWDVWCKLRAEPQSLVNIGYAGNPVNISFMGLPIIIDPTQGVMELVDGQT